MSEQQFYETVQREEEYTMTIKNLYNLSYYNEYGECIDYQDGVGPFCSIEEADIWAQTHLNEVELLTYKVQLLSKDYSLAD